VISGFSEFRVPHNKITGRHIISSKTNRIKSSAAQAFRKLIPSISQTKTALGAFYRRLAPRIGKAQAIIATCRKLAIFFTIRSHLERSIWSRES
jgi:hypothetical protein